MHRQLAHVGRYAARIGGIPSMKVLAQRFGVFNHSDLASLTARNAAARAQQLVREGGQLEAEEQRVVFGKSLPRGLRIE